MEIYTPTTKSRNSLTACKTIERTKFMRRRCHDPLLQSWEARCKCLPCNFKMFKLLFLISVTRRNFKISYNLYILIMDWLLKWFWLFRFTWENGTMISRCFVFVWFHLKFEFLMGSRESLKFLIRNIWNPLLLWNYFEYNRVVKLTEWWKALYKDITLIRRYERMKSLHYDATIHL